MDGATGTNRLTPGHPGGGKGAALTMGKGWRRPFGEVEALRGRGHQTLFTHGPCGGLLWAEIETRRFSLRPQWWGGGASGRGEMQRGVAKERGE